MHHVSSLSQISPEVPSSYEGKSQGFSRQTYVDHNVGSVHMGVSICSLEDGGHILHHLHSFEESFYILEGNVVCQIGEESWQLGSGYYGLLPTGTVHAWQNISGGPVRWLEMHAPQPRPTEYGRDTFFVDGQFPEKAKAPESELIGHFDPAMLPKPGEPSEMEGFDPVKGVAIKMFVDRSFGAVHQSLFFIQYQPGASIAPHDHTFEESYYIMSGRVQAVADGEQYDLGPGDVIWTSVGCIHSFENVGDEPVTWLETQASLPPAKEAFRFENDWAKYH